MILGSGGARPGSLLSTAERVGPPGLQGDAGCPDGCVPTRAPPPGSLALACFSSPRAGWWWPWALRPSGGPISGPPPVSSPGREAGRGEFPWCRAVCPGCQPACPAGELAPTGVLGQEGRGGPGPGASCVPWRNVAALSPAPHPVQQVSAPVSPPPGRRPHVATPYTGAQSRVDKWQPG